MLDFALQEAAAHSCQVVDLIGVIKMASDSVDITELHLQAGMLKGGNVVSKDTSSIYRLLLSLPARDCLRLIAVVSTCYFDSPSYEMLVRASSS